MQEQPIGGGTADPTTPVPPTRSRQPGGIGEALFQPPEVLFQPRAALPPSETVLISIYLTNEGIHAQVEAVVEQWLATADVSIDTRDEPVIGSWFRRMVGTWHRSNFSPVAREAFLTAAHAADSRLVQTQDAYVTSTLLQNVGPVLQSLQPTKDAVVRAGALLIVKVDWVVQVHQLTAAQQAILDHPSHLAASPTEIMTVLTISGPDAGETVLPTAAAAGQSEVTVAQMGGQTDARVRRRTRGRPSRA